MKHFLLFCLLLALSAPLKLSAQLPDGSTAPDWTLTDIFGVEHHLYDLLDDGKMVVIEFSATWCGPCWNYMLSGALETFWEEHGPNGIDDAQVFYIEADQNTGIEDLYGNTSGSQGNWVANIPFPIIDLQVGENTDNQYQITYYPTLFAVCSDRKLYELGQVPASYWAEFIQSCGLTGSLADTEPAACFGEGSATVEASGGVSPITYHWNTGVNGPVLQNVGAGTYSVTITEANHKTVVIDNIVITGADAPISLADSEIEPALCYSSSDGSISIELQEGALPYTFNWSNGAHTQNIGNLPQGSYSVNATDHNGCEFAASFDVDAPEELVAEYEVTPEYCAQEDGTIHLDIDGGSGAYDISASAGTVIGHNILDITAGIVSITIEDNHGCTWSDNVEIEFVPEPTLYFTPDPAINCVAPVTSVTGYVQQGSGDYDFEWTTPNGHIVGTPSQATIQVDAAGDYYLTVYDLFSGCEVQNSVEVESTVAEPTVTAGDDEPISCEVLLPQLTGVGDPGYTVSWSSPDGNIVSGGNTYQPIVDAPGLYIIHVLNPDNSCTNVDTVVVLDEVSPAEAAFQFQTSSLTMIGTDISGGSNVNGWSWTFGDGNLSSEPNVVHTYASAGIYEVCFSVQNGCGTSQICQSVEVTQTGSVLNVDGQVQNVLCNSAATGSIVLQVNGGSGVYSYLWTGPNGTSYTTSTIEALIAGDYQVVVTDDQGNVFISEFTITEPTAILLVGSTVIDNQCFGQTNGTLTVDVTGGVAPFSYSLNGGPAQSENVFVNLPGGEVITTVTDANGCAFEAGPYSIQEPSAVAVNSIQATDADNVENNNGSITLDIVGGVAPYTVLWSNGATGTTIDGLAPGSYTYVITDANDCVYSTDIPVVILGTTATQDFDWSAFISLAPNPTKGDVIVKWEGLDIQKGTMSLMTPEGRRLESKTINAGTGQWDLSGLNLASGLYVVLFEMDKQAVPFKLIVL